MQNPRMDVPRLTSVTAFCGFAIFRSSLVPWVEKRSQMNKKYPSPCRPSIAGQKVNYSAICRVWVGKFSWPKFSMYTRYAEDEALITQQYQSVCNVPMKILFSHNFTSEYGECNIQRHKHPHKYSSLIMFHLQFLPGINKFYTAT